MDIDFNSAIRPPRRRTQGLERHLADRLAGLAHQRPRQLRRRAAADVNLVFQGGAVRAGRELTPAAGDGSGIAHLR